MQNKVKRMRVGHVYAVIHIILRAVMRMVTARAAFYQNHLRP